jgi:DNA-binding LytR/AlgR family response regulator
MKALLIIDDERLARLELRRLLAAHPEVEIAGEARDGEEALALIAKLAPDVIFLDIQMPGMSGFDLLERLEDLPQVIFTTAYDEYALKAFEVNALDYLLKPVAPARLAAALATRAAPAGTRAPGAGLRARWRPLLDRSPARHLPAGIGGQLHARVLRQRTAADPPVVECAGGATRPGDVLPRGAQGDRQLEVDREGGYVGRPAGWR